MPAMDAVSLRHVLEGDTESHRPVVVSALGKWRMACDGRYKLVLGWDDGPLLFDLEVDPMEDENIARAQPEIVERLRMALS